MGVSKQNRDVDAAVAALIESAKRNAQSAPRKHHLIPASYLVRWSLETFLRVTETASLHTYTVRPEQAARETDFYSLAPDGIDPVELPPLLLETVLSRVEADGKQCIDILLEGGPRGLSPEDALHMATYIGFQLTRGRAFRLQMESATNQALLLMNRAISDPRIAQVLIEHGQDATSEAIGSTRQALTKWQAGDFRVGPEQAQSAGMAAAMACEHAFWLLAWPWRVYESLMPLITCDDPVVGVTGPSMDSRRQPGVATAGVILFPLDPHHRLAIFYPGLPMDDVALHPELLPSEASEVNLSLAANADRWVFDRPNLKRTTAISVPPWPPDRTSMEQITMVNDPEGEYHRTSRPTRWRPPFVPPPPPVERWWRLAGEPGLHDRPYDWKLMPDALYNVID